MGAILFCYNLKYFPYLARRAPRVITYSGPSRVKTLREKEFTKGYALDFDNIIEYIDIQLPKKEEIGRAFREEISMYPILAIRELVANALMHQNFNSDGVLFIEIFPYRIEISNAGKTLIDTLRFIDEAPKPRNRDIVKYMRRMNFAEDRGTGIDKVISEVESYKLTAPIFQEKNFSTVVTLFGTKDFSKMDMEERIRACYQHACLQWTLHKKMTNASLRERFGLSEKKQATISRVITSCLKKNLIKGQEESNQKKFYIPYWT